MRYIDALKHSEELVDKGYMQEEQLDAMMNLPWKTFVEVIERRMETYEEIKDNK